ncbi:MAG TPA: tetratricopeptide repeat protein [Drouetiella sp.]
MTYKTFAPVVLNCFVVLSTILGISCQPGLATDAPSEFESLFYFVDKSDKISIVAANIDDKVSDWTPEEKSIVKDVLFGIYKKYPWLVKNVCGKRKLGFVRLSIDAKKPARNSLANMMIGTIGIRDTFFKSPYNRHTLVHELVHAADFGSCVAYSPRWIKSVEPLIEQIRMREQFLDTDAYWVYNRFLNRTRTWVSIYGAKNLVEALAEYVSFEIENKRGREMTEPQASLLRRIKNPTETETQFRDIVIEGTILYIEKNYQEASEKLEEAYKLEPQNLLVMSQLAACYDRLKRRNEATNMVELALYVIETNGVPTDETEVLDILTHKAYDLMIARKWGEAKVVLDKILQKRPTNTYALERRSECENRMLEAAQSLTDLNTSRKNGLDWPNPLSNLKSDEAVVGDIIEALPDDAETPLRKALILSAMADLNSDTQVQKQYWNDALETLRKKIHKGKLGEQSRLERLYLSFDLTLKLQDFAQAKKFLAKIKRADDNKIRTNIASLHLLECQDSSDNRKYLIWKELDSDIRALQPQDKLVSPSPSFNVIERGSGLLTNPRFLIPASAKNNEYKMD